MPTDDQIRSATEAQHAGMARTDEAAGEEWREYADDFIYAYLVTHKYLFVDELWDAGLQGPEGASDRALGPRFRHAADAGWMVKTGEARKSVRSNMQLKPVWRSRVFESPVPQPVCGHQFVTDSGWTHCDLQKEHDGVHLSVDVVILGALPNSDYDSSGVVPQRIEAERERIEADLRSWVQANA